MIRQQTRKRRSKSKSKPTAIHSVSRISQPAFQPPISPFPPAPLLTEEQIEEIHAASLTLLSQYGIEVASPHARALYREAGACVDETSEVVRLEGTLVASLLASAPEQFVLTPTNAKRSLTIGGPHLHFGMVSGAPNVHCSVHGRRPGNFADYQNFIKLGQFFNAIHFFGNQTLAPNDLPVNTRHLDTALVNLTLADKVFLCMSIGKSRVRDTAEMLAIARGLTLDELAESPSCITNININSPRKFDSEMSDALISLASMGQAVVVTPFTLMGAMTPVSFAGALAQQNAEALLGICLTQIVRKGAPVVYGGFTSNVDMKSGAPAFGTPENVRANIAGGQLARHYCLPYRTSACSTSNLVDAQGVWETQMSLWGAVQGHGNLIYHAAGWQEGGLVASYEKFIVDVEMLQAMSVILAPVCVSDDELALFAHDEVAPGGHFFGASHTLSRYRDAFYTPLLSDWSNFENWRANGSMTATQRAIPIWQAVLENYEPPALDSARVEALDAFVARRKEEIGTGEL